jgi:hypothetical protein
MPVCPGRKRSSKDAAGQQRYTPCLLPPGTEQAPDQFLQLPRNGQKTELKSASTCLTCRLANMDKRHKAVEAADYRKQGQPKGLLIQTGVFQHHQHNSAGT